MPVSTQVKVTEGICCCEGLPICCNGIPVPEYLCMHLTPLPSPEADDWCSAFPRKILMVKGAGTYWSGYYCIPGCNGEIFAEIGCGVTSDGSQAVGVALSFNGTTVWMGDNSNPHTGGLVALICDPFFVGGTIFADLLGNLAVVHNSLCCSVTPSAFGLARSIQVEIREATDLGTGTDSGTGTYDCPPLGEPCMGTGTGTGTSTGSEACPCETDTFCADDGTDRTQLTYSSDCIWIGGSPSVQFFPNMGIVRRGVFPANFAEYSGPTGCDGGTYNKTAQTGPGPHPNTVVITPGDCCPCPTDTPFCGFDGTQTVTLNYTSDCLWSGGSPTMVFDPSLGVLRRGTFPTDYADYAGSVGCEGQILAKTFETGAGPHPDSVSVSPGAC